MSEMAVEGDAETGGGSGGGGRAFVMDRSSESSSLWRGDAPGDALGMYMLDGRWLLTLESIEA
jgi:hypothetical protein